MTRWGYLDDQNYAEERSKQSQNRVVYVVYTIRRTSTLIMQSTGASVQQYRQGELSLDRLKSLLIVVVLC